MQELKLCKDCSHFYPFIADPYGKPDISHHRVICYHPKSVSEIDPVYGNTQFTAAKAMRSTGECGQDALLFKEVPSGVILDYSEYKPISFWKRIFK
jgi:hypothetical protein